MANTDRVNAQLRVPLLTVALVVALVVGQVACGPGEPGLHALGQEPGWMVDITPGGEMRVLAQYGTDTITVPAPPPTVSAEGATVYRARTDERTVTVTVTDEPCRDVMSGQPFPKTVTLELDGERFRGCGESTGGGTGG